MDGNVREWCLDTWHKNYDCAPTDGSAWLAGGEPDSRVTRGGSWDLPAHFCRAAERNRCPPDSCRLEVFGFRVVLATRECAEPPKELDRLARPASNAKPRRAGFLEYRLAAVEGSPSQKFTWNDRSTSNDLETRPFITVYHIATARIRRARGTGGK